jgi:hypothetical protein
MKIMHLRCAMCIVYAPFNVYMKAWNSEIKHTNLVTDQFV